MLIRLRQELSISVKKQSTVQERVPNTERRNVLQQKRGNVRLSPVSEWPNDNRLGGSFSNPACRESARQPMKGASYSSEKAVHRSRKSVQHPKEDRSTTKTRKRETFSSYRVA